VDKLTTFLFLSFIAVPTARAENSSVQDYPWLDAMHQSIAESVNDTALWFDEFFFIDEFGENEDATGEARIRLGWEPRSRDLSEFETRLRLRVKLPNLKNRVDLVLSDYDDEQTDNSVIASGKDTFSEQNRFSLALRWKAKPNSGLSHRIGIGRRAQPFIKSRYRSIVELSEKSDLRWETSVYYYNRDGWGTDFSALIDFDLSKQSIFRFNNHFYYRDRSNDWLWRHSWQHLKQISEKTALISGFYIEGLSRPNYHLEEYLVSLRWRKNALREWLFYEIEPFVLWRKEENFSASYGLALRVEGFFGHG
jgi:hypothetical protein